MTVYLSLLVAIIGVIIYLACAAPKPAEIGRVMFSCGLLAFLLTSAAHVVNALK